MNETLIILLIVAGFCCYRSLKNNQTFSRCDLPLPTLETVNQMPLPTPTIVYQVTHKMQLPATKHLPPAVFRKSQLIQPIQITYYEVPLTDSSTFLYSYGSANNLQEYINISLSDLLYQHVTVDL